MAGSEYSVEQLHNVIVKVRRADNRRSGFGEST
jgi:hypothetical protein